MTAYSLGSDGSANQVLSLKQDRAGRLWIGTAGGLFVLEQPLREPSFRRVEPHPSTGPSALGQVLAFAEGPDGVLWIGTSTGLFRRLVDGQILREQTFRLVEEVRQLLVDRAGRIWIGTRPRLSVAVPARSTAPPNTSPSGRRSLSVAAVQMTRTFPLRLANPVDSRRSRECRRSYEACRLVPMAGCGLVRRAG